MRAKILKIVTVGLVLVATLCTLTACGGHTHAYNKQFAGEEYLVSEATCSAKAKYYLSCECGEKGTETFEYGDVSHNYDGNSSCLDCGETVNYTKGLYYVLSADQTYYTVSKGDAENETSISIPAKYQGKPVTAIGSFQSCKISSISIPEGITLINFYAFRDCVNLKVITIPASVVEIRGAFGGCTSLSHIYFTNPEGWGVYRHQQSNPKANKTAKEMSDATDIAKSMTNTEKYASYFYYRVTD